MQSVTETQFRWFLCSLKSSLPYVRINNKQWNVTSELHTSLSSLSVSWSWPLLLFMNREFALFDGFYYADQVHYQYWLSKITKITE